jgi:predicted MFS family arabinose efflux permease
MGRAWLVALVTIFAGISLGLVQNKVAPCMTTLMDAFSIDMATAGWLSSLFSLIGIVVALPASIILNRFGPKRGGVFALFCAIAGSLMGVFTADAAILMASRIIEGIGVGLISVIGPSLIAMWFPEAKRGLPMSIWGADQMGAQAVMFFLGSVLTVNFGWQGMWWFGLAACVLALVFYIICVKSPRPEDSFADVESADVSMAEGIKSPSTWLISLVTMLFCVGCFGFVNWIATCWSEIFGWSEGEANMWVGFFSIGGLVAAVVIGALLNKVTKRRRFGMIALLVYGVISLVGMNLPFPQMIALFVAVYAFADAGFPCVLWTMAAQTVKKPELAGVAMGVVCVGFNAGILLGPPITGAVAELWGWTAASILICAVCAAATVLLKFVKLY